MPIPLSSARVQCTSAKPQGRPMEQVGHPAADCNPLADTSLVWYGRTINCGDSSYPSCLPSCHTRQHRPRVDLSTSPPHSAQAQLEFSLLSSQSRFPHLFAQLPHTNSTKSTCCRNTHTTHIPQHKSGSRQGSTGSRKRPHAFRATHSLTFGESSVLRRPALFCLSRRVYRLFGI